MNAETERQQVLWLWLEDSALDGRVVGWSFFDGSGRESDLDGSPPYRRGVDALGEGWRLLQSSAVPVRLPGHERVTGRLEHEFLFERIVAK